MGASATSPRGLDFKNALHVPGACYDTTRRAMRGGAHELRLGAKFLRRYLRRITRSPSPGKTIWASFLQPCRNTMSSQSAASNPPLLAYKNQEFVDSDEGRSLRILAEYEEPLFRFRREQIHDTVVFFGSARLTEDGPLGRYYTDARELARRLTEWSGTLCGCCRFAVCSGGGGGIMEAANRGAADAGGRTIGLNIGLPHEQRPNQYISDGLSFEFHYFFMRKLWFSHLARALVVFPGGFGTLDELMEVLTLAQTRKLDRKILVLLYGSAYWQEIINFEALVRHGMVTKAELELFQFVDDPETAFSILKSRLPREPEPTSPAFAKSVTPSSAIMTPSFAATTDSSR